ncbi:hypothetical protein GJAV_G00082200 [Gymnothorax javanicus]|nr:hypothetical protein GJAV_G00082200 [Gymnothorax javanicus]
MNPLFTPPLYKQRYQFVVDFVKKHNPKKVVDLGCAECGLLRKLKFHRNIELLVGVDIDGSIVRNKMYSLAPFASDFLKPANGPLTVELYQGSVTEKDSRIRGFDLATCIELIEHLPVAEVERFSEVLFGYMSPTAVIVSTPNADFNPLLPGCNGFRHIDHKFEWNKVDFQNWALEVCRLRENLENTTSYTLLYDVVYPSLSDNNIFQRTLVNEVLCWAEHIKSRWLEASEEEVADRHSDTDFPCDFREQGISEEVPEPYLLGGAVCVPLARVLSFPGVYMLCSSLQRLQEALRSDSRVVLTEDALSVVLATGEEEETDVDEVWEDFGGPAYTESVKCAGVCTEDWDAEL